MKYVIDIPDFDKYNMPSATKGRVVAVPIIIGDKTFNIPTEMVFIGPYTEPDRKSIEDEVWKFVKTVSDMSYFDTEKCFDCLGLRNILDEYSYKEAKTKYNAWKASGDKESPVEVGDEVIAYDDIKAVVMDILKNGELIVFAESGCIEKWSKTHRAKKTGIHYEAVEGMLDTMRGDRYK